MVIIGTGSAVGVAIIVLMVLCLMKKRKKAETKLPDDTHEKNDETVPLMKEKSASSLSVVRSSSKRLPEGQEGHKFKASKI